MSVSLKIKLGGVFTATIIVALLSEAMLADISTRSQENIAQVASHSSSTIHRGVERSLQETQTKNSASFGLIHAVSDMQSAFLLQMVAWKNYLVRGHFDDMRSRYEKDMVAGDAHILALEQQVRAQILTNPEALNLLDQAMEEYAYLKKQIALGKSMIEFADSYDEGIRAADQYTGDKGISTIGYLKELTRVISARSLSMTQVTAASNLQDINTIISQSETEMAAVRHEARSQSSTVIVGASLTLLATFALALFFLIRRVIGPIHLIGRTLADGGHRLAQTSNSVAHSSHTLAHGASSQACAVEQTSASLEEISAMTRKNAENAGLVDTKMTAASEVVQRAGQTMDELTHSMQEISQASKETSSIIKTIDDIAFQTNILALNAAVEAARAGGEAGAGFAVVAEEVRRLAQRSAAAAKNTESMIARTINKTQKGSQLVQETHQAVTEIHHTTTEVTGLISEIAKASDEQVKGFQQINAALLDIDNITQENSAHADQSAMNADHLEHESKQLKQVVDSLIVLIAGTSPKPSRPDTDQQWSQTGNTNETLACVLQ